jgi:hypothetical protein
MVAEASNVLFTRVFADAVSMSQFVRSSVRTGDAAQPQPPGTLRGLLYLYASFTLGIPESDSRMKETNETRRQAALFRLRFR